MSQISTAYTTAITPQTPMPPPSAPDPGVRTTTPPSWPEDRFDFSGMTVREAIAKLDELRLADIRRQIKAGTYFNEHKLDVVVDRLAAVIKQDPPQSRSA